MILHMSRILYKYLTIDGAEWMLGMRKEREYPNLQFTNATQLNDPFDCHPNLVDFSDMPITDIFLSKGKCEKLASLLRKNTWLCSLSKRFNTLLMWSHYCSNHQGICIGLNMKNVKAYLPVIFLGTIGGGEPLELNVDYQNVIKRPQTYHSSVNPWYYQLQTKAKDWKYEKEVRLVIENHRYLFGTSLDHNVVRYNGRNIVSEWKEIHHYVELSPECFESIYFGVNTNPDEKAKIIKHMRNLNPHIKLYQMRVDENAFRLNAEPLSN